MPEGAEFWALIPVMGFVTGSVGNSVQPWSKPLVTTTKLPVNRCWTSVYGACHGHSVRQRNSLVVGFMMGAVIPIIFTIAEDAE